MSASNSIHIMGRITRDLELKYTASGVAVCAFAVAVSRSYKDSDGNYPADFIDCVAWRTTAISIHALWVEGDGRNTSKQNA